MNGLRLHARCLAHPLGGTPRGSGKQYAHTCRLQGGNDSFGRGGLARARTSREHHHLRGNGLPDGFYLHLVIFNAGFPLQLGEVEASSEDGTSFFCMNQSVQAVCRTALGIVEWRQVDGSAVEHQVLRLDGMGHGGADALLVGFKQLLCRGYQLFLFRIAMPLVCQLVERVDESAT